MLLAYAEAFELASGLWIICFIPYFRTVLMPVLYQTLS